MAVQSHKLHFLLQNHQGSLAIYESGWLEKAELNSETSDMDELRMNKTVEGRYDV